MRVRLDIGVTASLRGTGSLREPGAGLVAVGAIARAALREGIERFPVAFLDQDAAEIRLLCDNRDTVANERARLINRLRINLVVLDCSCIVVVEQFNAKMRTFTLPKNGLTREALLTDPAREVIMALPVESEFCFCIDLGEHWTASARAYHWKAVKVAAGWGGSLYLATVVLDEGRGETVAGV